MVLHGDIDAAMARFWQDTRDRYRLVQGDPERPTLPPAALFLGAEQFYGHANAYPQLALRNPDPLRATAQDHQDSWSPLPDLTAVRGAEEPLMRLQRHLASSPHRVLILAESEGRRESLFDFL